MTRNFLVGSPIWPTKPKYWLLLISYIVGAAVTLYISVMHFLYQKPFGDIPLFSFTAFPFDFWFILLNLLFIIWFILEVRNVIRKKSLYSVGFIFFLLGWFILSVAAFGLISEDHLLIAISFFVVSIGLIIKIGAVLFDKNAVQSQIG